MEIAQIRTAHFTLDELCKSETAERAGIDNAPTPEATKNLCDLMTEVLEPARCKLGVPIRVTSGYRCPRLNRLVGGVNTSQHMRGQAADLQCSKESDLRRLFNILAQMDIDQLLYERNSKGSVWVHVSFDAHGVNRQFVKDNYIVK